MPESQRVINGSKTKGSQVLTVTIEGERSVNIFGGKIIPSEGWTNSDRKILEVSMRTLVRTNSDDARVVNGKRISRITYDDSEFTPSGGSNHYANINSRRSTFILNHEVENRDLGQHKLYSDDIAFREMTNPDDPIEIITTHPDRLYLPISMVDFSSEDALDGVVDPLNTRKNIDRSTIEIPYTLQGIRGSLFNEDIFRNVEEFRDGFNLLEQTTQPSVDAIEFFGPVELPPIVFPDNRRIKPFTDKGSYLELYFERQQRRQGISVDEDMRAAIINGNNNSSFDESDQREFDIEPARGSDEPGGAAFRGMEK